MLDLDPNRPGSSPRDASTLVVVRDAAGGGVEVFCVERHRSGFLGGAIVFPGGKLDASDLAPEWAARTTALSPSSTRLAADEATARGLAIAACREALEESAILPIAGPGASHAELLEWRTAMARPAPHAASLRALLAERDQRLDLGALHPLARWVTPTSEARRFDTRFFLFVAGPALEGRHDDRETTASFWGHPALVLDWYAAGELQLAPPTHRTLELLAALRGTADAVAMAGAACLEPICPELVPHRDAAGETMALVLPGDPEHSVPVARVAGRSRFVFRQGRFLPEDPPPA